MHISRAKAHENRLSMSTQGDHCWHLVPNKVMMKLDQNGSRNLIRSGASLLMFWLSVLILLFGESQPIWGMKLKDWTNRVIPLPKKIQVAGSVPQNSRGVRLVLPVSGHPLVQTAAALLQPLASGEGPFEIRLMLIDDPETQVSMSLRRQLGELPNRDQAYAIVPVEHRGAFAGLKLVANTPLGLLYSARTLVQLVSPSPKGRIEFPIATLLDWPDLAERGEWGGNTTDDLPWMAERKLNVVEMLAQLGFDANRQPEASVNPAILERAQSVGIKIVPIITHLEQLASTGLFQLYPEVAATPDPEKPLPTDYSPAVCHSEPRTVELLAGWMRRLLALPGVDEVMVWLSETLAPCYCSRCRGQDPFVMEVQDINKAFDKARDGKPAVRLRILTTQASFPVNDKILASANPETRISYYDGGRTYDSSHRPMIYPLLEDFARSGRWLGIYPQLTNSWRTVFPFTGPQFIRNRMSEFADKRLSSLIGYATPSNRYYEFNITAAAEWSWNSKGRSPREFALAYATRIKHPRPEQFAEWAELIGTIGWDLASIRLVERLISSPGRALSEVPEAVELRLDRLPRMQFGQGFLSEFSNETALAARTEAARKAVQLAEASRISQMVYESRSVLAAFELLRGLHQLSLSRDATETTQSSQVASALATIDEATQTLTVSLHRWGVAVNPVSRDALPSRFRDTVNFASRLASALRQIGKPLNIRDPHPDYRLQPLRTWKESDLTATGHSVLWADATDLLKQAGDYDVTFQFGTGSVGLDTHSVQLLKGTSQSVASVVDGERWEFHVGRWDRWVEYGLSVPSAVFNSEKTGDRLFIKLEVSLPPTPSSSSMRTSQGQILVRKSWRNARL